MKFDRDMTPGKLKQTVHNDSQEPIPKPDKRTMVDKDKLTEDLLYLINDYERVAEKFKTGYIEGYLELSKKKLYNDFILDLRDRDAVLTIDGKDKQYKLINGLQLDDNEVSEKSLDETTETDEPDDVMALRNRLSKVKITKEVGDKKHVDGKHKKTVQNPIKQFGLINLKSLQDQFIENIEVSIQLVNLQTKIVQLVEQIQNTDTDKDNI